MAGAASRSRAGLTAAGRAVPDADTLRRARTAAQLLLSRRAATATQVVGRLLAVQAQDFRSARLALRARSSRLTAAGVDRALGDGGTLVVGWLLRGTLHLVRRDDYPWLLGLTAPTRTAASRRRVAQEGVAPADADRAVALVRRALTAEGPLTRPELVERLARRGIRIEGQAAHHLVVVAALRGVAVLGPVREGRQAFVLARDVLGGEPPTALAGERREAALAELARRYLAGHGPASPQDLASWSGLSLRDARAALRLLRGSVREVGGGLLDLAGRPPPFAGRAPPRLLPAFDPYLLGWRDRSFAVPAAHARRLHPGGGILRPVALVGGAAAGTWSARRRGDRLAVEIEPFGRLGRAAERALAEDAADVARFEGLRPS